MLQVFFHRVTVKSPSGCLARPVCPLLFRIDRTMCTGIPAPGYSGRPAFRSPRPKPPSAGQYSRSRPVQPPRMDRQPPAVCPSRRVAPSASSRAEKECERDLCLKPEPHRSRPKGHSESFWDSYGLANQDKFPSILPRDLPRQKENVRHPVETPEPPPQNPHRRTLPGRTPRPMLVLV